MKNARIQLLREIKRTRRQLKKMKNPRLKLLREIKRPRRLRLRERLIRHQLRLRPRRLRLREKLIRHRLRLRPLKTRQRLRQSPLMPLPNPRQMLQKRKQMLQLKNQRRKARPMLKSPKLRPLPMLSRPRRKPTLRKRRLLPRSRPHRPRRP